MYFIFFNKTKKKAKHGGKYKLNMGGKYMLILLSSKSKNYTQKGLNHEDTFTLFTTHRISQYMYILTAL